MCTQTLKSQSITLKQHYPLRPIEADGKRGEGEVAKQRVVTLTQKENRNLVLNIRLILKSHQLFTVE